MCSGQRAGGHFVVVLNDGTIAGKLGRKGGRRQQETADVEARCQHRTYKFYTFQSGNPPQNIGSRDITLNLRIFK